MSSKQIYFSEEEEIKIKKYAVKWNIAEYEVVKRMVRDFKNNKEVEK